MKVDDGTLQFECTAVSMPNLFKNLRGMITQRPHGEALLLIRSQSLVVPVVKLPSLSTMIGVPSIHSGQCSETQFRVAHSQMS